MTQARGRTWLFWVAFGSMLCAAVAIVAAIRSFLDSLTPLWISIGFSTAATVAAVSAVMLRRAPKS